MSDLNDRLDAIQRRVDADKAHFANGNAIQLDDSKDRAFLLDLVRKQQDELDSIGDIA